MLFSMIYFSNNAALNLKHALVNIHYIDVPSYLGIVLSGLLAKYLETIEDDPERVGFCLISPLSDVVKHDIFL